jgi:hypothetical protein
MPESDAAPILTTPPSNGHGVAADSVDVDEPHTDETDDHAAIDEPQPSRNVVAAGPEEDAIESDQPSEESGAGEPAEEGPVHRRLIRATLPRIEGQKDVRPVPEFTIRQPGTGRGNGNFRGGGGDARMKAMRPGQGANGNRAQQGGHRFGNNRPSGQGRGSGRGGPSGGFRGQSQPRQGGGRKRSR